jgi:hypothetical protein
MPEISGLNRLIANKTVADVMIDGDEDGLVAEVIAEYLEAQDELKRKGYGVSGAGLLQMIREEVPDAAP